MSVHTTRKCKRNFRRADDTCMLSKAAFGDNSENTSVQRKLLASSVKLEKYFRATAAFGDNSNINSDW